MNMQESYMMHLCKYNLNNIGIIISEQQNIDNKLVKLNWAILFRIRYKIHYITKRYNATT